LHFQPNLFIFIHQTGLEGTLMTKKPTYEELEQQIKKLQKEAAQRRRTEKASFKE